MPPTTASTLSLAVAGRFIDGLVARDFGAVADTLVEDVSFRALTPRRVLDVAGADAVRSTFTAWFGEADRWEVVEAVVGEVGGRVHLQWRIHCLHPGVGEGAFVIEQQVYADAAPDGRLCNLALLCTGFRPAGS